jgi:hypothetical protein
MCIATHWFGWGEKNMRANVEVERLNIAIKAATYHIIGCRLVQLDGITLVNTTKPTYNQLPSNRIMDPNITSRNVFVNYMRNSITGWDLITTQIEESGNNCAKYSTIRVSSQIGNFQE